LGDSALRLHSLLLHTKKQEEKEKEKEKEEGEDEENSTFPNRLSTLISLLSSQALAGINHVNHEIACAFYLE